MLVKASKPCFSIKKAHETQLKMSKQIVFEDKLPAKIRFIAGVDVAYTKELSIGAVVVLDYNSLRLVEAQIATCKTMFPYVPTLLSFREVPPTVLSIKKLSVNPEVFLVDGQGFAHPYGCGFASHLGLVIGKPTIGVAKSKLFGELENKGEKDVAFLRHDGKIVGARVITKRGCKPVYVSVGHMVSLETAIKIVKHCAIYNRIPEPILKAHEVATAEKRKIK
jgi:deoxyribonuclease V